MKRLFDAVAAEYLAVVENVGEEFGLPPLGLHLMAVTWLAGSLALYELGIRVSHLLLLVLYIPFVTLFVPAVLGISWLLVGRRARRTRRVQDALERLLGEQRHGLQEVRRVGPRELIGTVARRARVTRPRADAALGGLTVTLDHLVREPARVRSRELPFPELGPDTERLLEQAVRNGSAVGRRAARRIVAAVSASIGAELQRARADRRAGVEVFPLGLYRDLQAEIPVFWPHSALISRHYPDVAGLLLDPRRWHGRV